METGRQSALSSVPVRPSLMPKSALCPGFPDFGRHVTPQGVVSGVDTGTLAQLRRGLPAIGEVVAPIRHADKPNEKGTKELCVSNE